MRTTLIQSLIAELTPMDPAALRAANRQHALTLDEFDAVTRGLMDKQLAANNAAHAATSTEESETMADDTSIYKREQALATQGISVRRANHFEEVVNEYGEKLTWVVDLGGQTQARKAYKTKEAALEAAETYL